MSVEMKRVRLVRTVTYTAEAEVPADMDLTEYAFSELSDDADEALGELESDAYLDGGEVEIQLIKDGESSDDPRRFLGRFESELEAEDGA